MTTPSLPPDGIGDRVTMPGRAPRAMPPVVLAPPPPASPRRAIAAGAIMARSRLARRSSAVALSLALALTAMGALIERGAGKAGAVDRALAGCFGLVLPLFTFWVVGAVTARERLGDAAWPAARFGLPRREVVLGLVLAGAAAAAAGSALCAVFAVVVASSPSSPPVLHDAFLSAWIAALTAFAYVGWFSFGSTFLRFGAGRAVPLVVDFLIGGSAGIAGAFLPRGNASNLLGAAAPLGLTQPSSTAILIASAVALGIASALRSKD